MQIARLLPLCVSMLVALVISTSVAYGQQRKAPFVDEGNKDATFSAYRKTLLQAIADRDVETVVAAAAPDIHLDFGGGEGRDEFRKRLTVTEADLSDEYAHLADEHREQYWDALEVVLRLGGVIREPDGFAAPYTWVVALKDGEDPYTTGFVIGSDAPLRSRPSRYGDIIAILDEDIVTILQGGKGTDFLEVRVSDGRNGFIHKDQVRSAIDYRALFNRSADGWQMTVFIAGD